MIHVAITRRVRPGKEAEFEEALRLFFAEALDGSSGAALLRPAGGDHAYGVLRSFADAAERDAFYASETYRRWQERVRPLVEGEVERRELHGLEAFVRTEGASAPPTWKMAVLTWVGVNPAVWIFAHGVPALAPGLPPLVELILVNALVVASLTWGFMPALTRLARGWLR